MTISQKMGMNDEHAQSVSVERHNLTSSTMVRIRSVTDVKDVDTKINVLMALTL